MPRYVVQFDYVLRGEDEYETEDGEIIYEEYEDNESDEVELEAAGYDEARELFYARYAHEYEDATIWNVALVVG